VRDGRVVPFAAVDSGAGDEPAVAAERFLGPEQQYAGHWASRPRQWDELPEEIFLAAEARAAVQRAIAALPATQRAEITLRDIDGWTAHEICNVLELSETNQRVLLHRARAQAPPRVGAAPRRWAGGGTMYDDELSCQELVELVTAYLDDALAPSTRQRFEQHHTGCSGCRAYLAQMRATIRLLGTLTPATCQLTRGVSCSWHSAPGSRATPDADMSSAAAQGVVRVAWGGASLARMSPTEITLTIT
jgi:hypothetical protein